LGIVGHDPGDDLGAVGGVEPFEDVPYVGFDGVGSEDPVTRLIRAATLTPDLLKLP
jgi:hypothetical protein